MQRGEVMQADAPGGLVLVVCCCEEGIIQGSQDWQADADVAEQVAVYLHGLVCVTSVDSQPLPMCRMGLWMRDCCQIA